MQTTSLHLLRLQPPFSGNLTSPKRLQSPRTGASSPVLAMRRDRKSDKGHDDHKLVDENMIILKMRIQELTTKEEESRGTTSSAPDHWMEWEKEWYKSYDSDVYEFVGFLQNVLMNARPRVVVGVVALLMLSTSTSLALVLTYLLNSTVM